MLFTCTPHSGALRDTGERFTRGSECALEQRVYVTLDRSGVFFCQMLCVEPIKSRDFCQIPKQTR